MKGVLCQHGKSPYMYVPNPDRNDMRTLHATFSHHILHLFRMDFKPPFLNPCTWSAGQPKVTVLYKKSLGTVPVVPLLARLVRTWSLRMWRLTGMNCNIMFAICVVGLKPQLSKGLGEKQHARTQ